MAKRWGRNQKRKAREEAQRLKGRIEYFREGCKDLKESRKRNAYIIEEMAIVFGKYFAGLPTKEVDQCHPSPDFLEVVRHPERYRYSPAVDSNFVEECTDILRLPCMKVHVDKFRAVQEIRVTYNGHQAGYALSPEKLRLWPKGWVVRDVAEEIAKFLVDDIEGDVIC